MKQADEYEVVVDSSIGIGFAKHVSRFGIYCYTSYHVRKYFQQSKGEFKLTDKKFILFAKKLGRPLFTADKLMYERAISENCQAIFVNSKSCLWFKIFRLLQKLNHPFYDLRLFVDFRNYFNPFGPAEGYGATLEQKRHRIESQLNDDTYLHQSAFIVHPHIE